MDTSPYAQDEMYPMDVSEQSLYPGGNSNLPKVVEDENFGLEDTQLYDLKPMADYSGSHELKSWLCRRPDEWTSTDVLSWIMDWVQDCEEIDFKMLHAEKFNHLTGQKLSQMTLEDFVALEPNYGTQIYEAFQGLKNNTDWISSCSYIEDTHEQNQQLIDDNYSMLAMLHSENMDEYVINDSSLLQPAVSPEATFEFVTRPHRTSSCSSSGYGTDVSVTEQVGFTDLYSPDSSIDELPLPPFATLVKGSSSSYNYIPSVVANDHERRCESPKPNKRGRPRKIPGKEISVQQKSSHRGRKQGQTSKGSHLWEFVCDLLRDPRHNPSIIRWENKQDGVFRFVKSEQVAKLWGQKKNNITMTYEKLSRAMRFCRTSGFFADVPKDRNFPKKLCFRFGPKASGWENL